MLGPIGLSPISTGRQQCLTMKTRSKRSLSDDIEIPFVRMLMVFQNTDPEPMIMQIAEKIIAKRLKNNFNDRVFDITTGTIIDHTTTVTINFYKVCLKSEFGGLGQEFEHLSAEFGSIFNLIFVSYFKTFDKEVGRTVNEIQVSFIIENEYLCNNPVAFQGLIVF